jgi:hypothetical protein
MKPLIIVALLSLMPLTGHAAPQKLSQDREAILAMAGSFEVDFNFRETVPLAKDYELKKPYSAKAHELVKVIEDTGEQITLQHLLIVEDFAGPSVIKHWSQVWQFEDPQSLTYQGKKTWLPVTHSEADTQGTWTQLVTQVDDSPRYKAQGSWTHEGNTSIWTSKSSTRPLPRRDYTKRSDYDLLVVVNQHIISPEGWVHLQDNRKLVSRDGQDQFLCIENGLNHYRRIPDDKHKEGFALAEKEWAESKDFWKEVRESWLKIIADAKKPVSYARRVDGIPLMAAMGKLEKASIDAKKVDPEAINQALQQYLR